MVSMKDIAAAAGVSQSTVSFVLSGRYQKDLKISPEVVQKVKDMASKMQYRRNALAGAMKNGRTNIVGFIGDLGKVGHNYVLNMINGASKALQQRGYLLKMFSLDEDNFTAISRHCVEQMLCGVIGRSFTHKQLNILHKELNQYHIPVVLLGNSFQNNWYPCVISDDISGCKIAIRHLTSLAHRKIGHLTQKDNLSVFSLRSQGYAEGMDEAGLSIPECNSLCLDKDYALGDEYCQIFDEYYTRVKPTAMLCASDNLAMKLLLWAYKRNIKVPEQLSVVGFGNTENSMLTCPPLTTIGHPYEQMGRRAAEKLLDLVEQRNIHQADELLKVELIIRESTAICREM